MNRKTGTVDHYSLEKGFGFIKPDNGEQKIYFHRKKLPEKTKVAKGVKVTYATTKSQGQHKDMTKQRICNSQ